MVDLKPVSQSDRETPTTNHHGFRRHKLLLFIIASVLAHSLGLLIFDVYQRFQPSSENKTDSKPIEFVVVPEEPSEPPPETDKRAAENSVAEQNNEPEKTPATEELDEEVASEPTSTPPQESTPAPKIASPPTPPEPTTPAQPTPPPQPEPEPIEPAEPTPPPQPEPSASPEPVNNQPPVLSDSDTVSTPEPEPVAPEESTPKPTPQPAETEAPVATRVPPNESIEPSESELPPTTTTPSESENSASSLLGGNYKRTLADDGADAFFSPEALAYRDVLNPDQLDALKDIDLGAYFAEVKRRVKSNWIPSHRAEEYTTFLTFNIEKNGQITGLRVTQSSGSEQVDRETIEAIQNSAPFAPLPPDFPLEALEVKFSFNIHIY